MPPLPLLNPFADDIVKEPRQIEPGIAGLNDLPLERLLQEFSLLEEGAIPRPERWVTHARLVVSPQPGYGKSHLLGRLFGRLAGRATLVNVRPFRVSEGDWSALLSHTVDELRARDRFSTHTPHTQLEVFAHGVLSHLSAAWLRSVPRHAAQPVLHALLQAPLETHQAAREYPSWPKVVDKLMTSHMEALLATLRHHLPVLQAKPESWLRLFHKVGFQELKPQLMESVLDWLKGEAIPEGDAQEIGLLPGDFPPWDCSLSERNALAKKRAKDLCRLAVFFRPFLFCFDQTETYGEGKKLAYSFGQLVQEMQQELPNQLTVMTANLDPWSKKISRHWEEAALHRVASPLQLDGLTLEQGRRLIRNRLERCRAEKKLARFEQDKWLEETFSGRKKTGVRIFLQECQKHWEEVFNGQTMFAPTLEESFAALTQRATESPSRLLFDQDRLLWCVETALDETEGGSLKREGKSFTLLWRAKDQKPLLIHLDRGNHWKHWQRIAQQASTHRKNHRTLYLRTPELSPIPREGWQVATPIIREAFKQGALRVAVVDKPMLATLYAAWDLHAEASAGDLPFSVKEVQAFLRSALQEFRTWLLASPATTGEPPPPSPPTTVDEALAKRLHTLMSRSKMLTEQEVLHKLGEQIAHETLHLAREQVPEIHLQPGPSMTVWLWIPRKS